MWRLWVNDKNRSAIVTDFQPHGAGWVMECENAWYEVVLEAGKKLARSRDFTLTQKSNRLELEPERLI